MQSTLIVGFLELVHFLPGVLHTRMQLRNKQRNDINDWYSECNWVWLITKSESGSGTGPSQCVPFVSTSLAGSLQWHMRYNMKHQMDKSLSGSWEPIKYFVTIGMVSRHICKVATLRFSTKAKVDIYFNS